MVRLIMRVVVWLALAMAVDYLWLDHRMMSQLPVQGWLDRCAQAIEEFGRVLISG